MQTDKQMHWDKRSLKNYYTTDIKCTEQTHVIAYTVQNNTSK